MPKPRSLAALRVVAPVILLIGGAYGCATGSTAHWEKPGGDERAFQADNERCGTVANRVASACSPGPTSCGAVAPRNRMDAPPHVDANPVFQREYMSCMAERGWRVAQQ